MSCIKLSFKQNQANLFRLIRKEQHKEAWKHMQKDCFKARKASKELLSKHLLQRTQQYRGCKKPLRNDKFVRKIMLSNYHTEYKLFLIVRPFSSDCVKKICNLVYMSLLCISIEEKTR